jgi:hypothetical protein
MLWQTLRLRTSDFDELVYMLGIPLDGFGSPVIDATDFAQIARAASTETPEMLDLPHRQRKMHIGL